MAMDQFLADYYGTNKTAAAAQEEAEKTATVEMFLKLAAEQNIDLRSMPDADVQKLYESWVEKSAAKVQTPAAPVAKTASDKEKEEHDKKVEEAKKEHEEKRAMVKKAEEADAMGRIMAHSFFQEYRSIIDGLTKQGGELPPALAAHMKGKGEGEGEKKEEKQPEEKKDEHEEKKGSALDDLAAEHAVAIVKAAKDAGQAYDPEEAKAKVAAVRLLNLCPQTTKTASAPNVQAAVEIRALELLEKAGYPITWTT